MKPIPQNVPVTIFLLNRMGAVSCIVTEENLYGHRINILAAESKRSDDRYINEPLSKFLIKKWEPINPMELPLLIGMPYISPLLEQIFRDGGLKL